MKQIVFIGDETLGDYFDAVVRRLGSSVESWKPDKAVSNSFTALENIHDWVLRRQPDVVHVGVGIADTRAICHGVEQRLGTLENYRRNVELILRLITERSTATPVWATITPVDSRRFARNEDATPCEYYDNEVIARYNEEAREVAATFGVEVNDLYGFVKAASREDTLRPDGVRFCQEGNELIASKVSRVVSAALGGLSG